MSERGLPMRQAGPAFGALLLLAGAAFWPGYLAQLPQPQPPFSSWLHAHAASATLWMLVLIAQPIAIHHGHRQLHRWIGRATLLLMPVVVLCFIGLAHASMQGRTRQEAAVDAYFFYIRVVLLALFVFAYVMAMIHRREPAVHARYMVCTGLALIDPVLHRLANRASHGADFNYQLLTFGAVLLILALLMLAERGQRAGRRVFPIMFGAYFIAGLPLALNFYTWGPPWALWKSIAARFAALPW